jgi:hypothetical protein
MYTIDGGGVTPGTTLVHRISLGSPRFFGPLLGQIDKYFMRFSARCLLRRLRWKSTVMRAVYS